MANANNYINNSRFFTAKEFIRLIDLFDNVDNGGMKLMFMTLIGGFMKYFFLFLTEISLRLCFFYQKYSSYFVYVFYDIRHYVLPLEHYGRIYAFSDNNSI